MERLSTCPDGYLLGEFDVIPAQLALVSIGYKSLSVPGLPFDARSGTVPNTRGKVLSANTTAALLLNDAPSVTPDSKQQLPVGDDHPPSAFEAGLYVCGWLKRGPSGIIGTNLVDADETVASLVQDDEAGLLPSRGGVSGPSRSASGGGLVLPSGRDALPLKDLLLERGVASVDFEGWMRLDKAECDAGTREGRARSKFTDLGEMLRISNGRSHG